MAYFKCRKCKNISNIRISSKRGLFCQSCGAKLTDSMLIKSKKQMKDKAWQSFSRYIRLRDCILTTGTKDEGVCFTCKDRLPINKLQAGHLVDGRTDAVLFDENNVKAQCYACNVAKHGKQGVFLLNRLDEMVLDGCSVEEAVESLKDLFFNDTNKSYSIEELSNIKDEYDSRYQKLLMLGDNEIASIRESKDDFL